jgi:hypothetical protein
MYNIECPVGEKIVEHEGPQPFVSLSRNLQGFFLNLAEKFVFREISRIYNFPNLSTTNR